MHAEPTQSNAPALSAEALRELALKHGFDDIRVTDGRAHEAAARTFADWLAARRHADMLWLEKDPPRRTTPSLHIAEACSVIMLAVNYHRPPAACGTHEGRVSQYAAGTDYHRVIDKELKAFCRDLKDAASHGRARFYVDYGPVLERAFAERAGLGFIGRSANLIHPVHGTYVFLATVVTDLPLPVDLPGEGTCGECRRCIEVCPTGALRGPFEIDASLCISYLTIENRGPIPRRLRPLIQNWLFGCDLCQEVCPYNSKARQGDNVRIARETIAGTSLGLCEVLGIRTDEAFAQRFAGSPLKRAKRTGLLRNAAVVAGNSGDLGLVSALEAALDDESPLVRGHAVWALGQLGAHDVVGVRQGQEHDAFVLDEIARVIGDESTSRT